MNERPDINTFLYNDLLTDPVEKLSETAGELDVLAKKQPVCVLFAIICSSLHVFLGRTYKNKSS